MSPETWGVHLLADAADYRVGASTTIAVTIGDDRAPEVLGPDGETERDYGNADWPTDAEIAAEASRQIGCPVRVRFFDKGDSLTEGLYAVYVAEVQP